MSREGSERGLRAAAVARPSRLSAIYNPECQACILSAYCKTVCVPASGDPASRAMVVGEGPGVNEDRLGKPFVGPAGEILNTALQEAFGSEDVREAVFVTNVVKCRPPKNRTPTYQEVKTCSNLYLKKEIEVVDPLCILALGNPACQALIGAQGISSLHGVWHRLPDKFAHGKMIWVMPAYHPMYVGYSRHKPEIAEQFQQDVSTFAKKWSSLYGGDK